MITAWKAAHPSVSGHEGGYAMREIVNAIGRTGCQWGYLPHDLPPRSAVRYYYDLWRKDGTTETIHELLRCQLREKMGRLEDPSLVVLDTQSLHAAVGVPAATTGGGLRPGPGAPLSGGVPCATRRVSSRSGASGGGSGLR